MDHLRSFAISAAGMAVERTRVDVAALNLANAHTVRGPGEAGYQPLRVVAQAGAGMAGGTATFSEQVGMALDGMGLESALPEVSVEPSGDGPRLVYEPGHPFADQKGFVAYPAVDAATEMVSLMSAMRAYEANVAAMNTTRGLALKTLEIGGGQ
jgi:flagellar basal-body rod protein FlgC